MTDSVVILCLSSTFTPFVTFTSKASSLAEIKGILFEAGAEQHPRTFHLRDHRCSAGWKHKSRRRMMLGIPNDYSALWHSLSKHTHSPITQTQAKPLLCCHSTKLGLLKHFSHAHMTLVLLAESDMRQAEPNLTTEENQSDIIKKTHPASVLFFLSIHICTHTQLGSSHSSRFNLTALGTVYMEILTSVLVTFQ